MVLPSLTITVLCNHNNKYNVVCTPIRIRNSSIMQYLVALVVFCLLGDDFCTLGLQIHLLGAGTSVSIYTYMYDGIKHNIC
jgi:hypothetical protein